MPPITTPARRAPWFTAAGFVLLGMGFVEPALAGPVERAREAQARGDLRAAQIEYRNAVRAEPGSAALRADLAIASLDLGDGATAEKEARAALERGYDPARGTALVLRGYLTAGRSADLLREFPENAAGPAAVRGQVAAGRALAQLQLEQAGAARDSVATALRLAPEAAEPHLAAAALALGEGDMAAAEAAVDRAVAADPESADALLRKAGLLASRGEMPAAVDLYGRLLARVPGHVLARLRRAEAFIVLGDDGRARADVDAALTTLPNSGPGVYLRAMLLGRAGDWRAADEALQRVSAMLGSFPDGYLLLATAKRNVGQIAQAEDAARRHVARRPEDPRGAKLLATLELAGNRPDAAVPPLRRVVDAGGADAEAFDLLGRAHAAAGRPREAAAAFAEAAKLAPADAGIQARLAAVRLALGDAAGAAEAAREALRLDPNQRGGREMLAMALLARGDLTGTSAEVERLDAAAKRGEAAGVLEGGLALARLDLGAARIIFERVLRDHPDSVGARLGLARVLADQNEPAGSERLLGELLRRDPGNAEAATRLSAAALSGGPRAAPARAVLEAAQAAAPGDPGLALRLADVLVRTGAPGRAIALLDAEPLRAASVPELAIARGEVRLAAGQVTEALEVSRTAVAEFPDSVAALQQRAALLLRAGDPRGAETVLTEALRARPGHPGLQGSLIAFTLQTRGLDAALAASDRLAAQPAGQPAAGTLRGDLLMSAQRPEEAARAYAAAFAARPSAMLATRQATALRAAGRADAATTLLRDWLRQDPNDIGVQITLASVDIEVGRLRDAEERLTAVLAQSPDNPVVLNNLAWVVGQKGGEEVRRGRTLAERAYFLLPNAETADTFGWLLARTGEPQRAVPLLRQSFAARASAQRPDPGGAYRLAFALHAAGEREEAIRVLEPALGGGAFTERREAERLLTELRAGR